jgi:iron complex outermembrane receptor protein
MIWGAISRAVRTPSRVDRDFALSLAPDFPVLTGGPDFTSEDLLAYELGWRLQPRPNLSLSVSTFYNRYDHLRSAEPGPPPFGLPIVISNGVDGDSFGAEFLAVYKVTDSWRLRAGYTLMRKQLSPKSGSLDLNQGTVESDDPENQFQIQSSLNLPGGFQLDTTFRYVDALPNPYVPNYTGLDLRLGWSPSPALVLSVVGQNLLDAQHPEFVPSSPSPREIERSIYAKIAWRY